MATRNVITRIRTVFDRSGTDSAKQGFDEVSDSAQQMGREAAAAGKSGEAGLRDVTGAAQEADRALAKVSGGAVRMGADVGTASATGGSGLRDTALAAVIAADEIGEMGEKAQRSSKQAKDGFGGVRAGLADLKTAALGVVAAIVLIGKSLLDAGKSGTDFAADLNLVSQATGIGTGRMRELERAVNRTGNDLSDLRGIFTGLQSAVGEALRGNEAYSEALRGIGLEVSALRGLGPEELLRKITDAILGLGEIDVEEFSFISQLLGDDDAARVIASAADLKEGLLAELTITDAEIEDALNSKKIVSDAENLREDTELALAGDGTAPLLSAYLENLKSESNEFFGEALAAFADPVNESTEGVLIKRLWNYLFGDEEGGDTSQAIKDRIIEIGLESYGEGISELNTKLAEVDGAEGFGGGVFARWAQHADDLNIGPFNDSGFVERFSGNLGTIQKALGKYGDEANRINPYAVSLAQNLGLLPKDLSKEALSIEQIADAAFEARKKFTPAADSLREYLDQIDRLRRFAEELGDLDPSGELGVGGVFAVGAKRIGTRTDPGSYGPYGRSGHTDDEGVATSSDDETPYDGVWGTGGVGGPI